MKVLIARSRNFNNYELLVETIQSIFRNQKIDCIISGGARGADALGERYAKEHNIPVDQYLPDWEKYGKSAGIKRNKIMCNVADYLVAFWDGESRGTAFTIQYMQNIGKQGTVCRYRG